MGVGMAEGKERYVIVRVEQQCPFGYEKQNEKAFLSRCLTSTFQCKDCYGDTKEQLVRKVAQVRLKQKIKRWYGSFLPSKLTIEFMYEKCLEQAKEIVEFLGVK